MVPVQRTSTAWNMCAEDEAMNVGDYKTFRPPPPEACGPGYWSEGVWMKNAKDENEHGHVGPNLHLLTRGTLMVNGSKVERRRDQLHYLRVPSLAPP
eukprot:2638330-Amphidinium_carterae.1